MLVACRRNIGNPVLICNPPYLCCGECLQPFLTRLCVNSLESLYRDLPNPITTGKMHNLLRRCIFYLLSTHIGSFMRWNHSNLIGIFQQMGITRIHVRHLHRQKMNDLTWPQFMNNGSILKQLNIGRNDLLIHLFFCSYDRENLARCALSIFQ